MEKGNAADFKNKSLDEIEIDMEDIILDKNDYDDTYEDTLEVIPGNIFIKVLIQLVNNYPIGFVDINEKNETMKQNSNKQSETENVQLFVAKQIEQSRNTLISVESNNMVKMPQDKKTSEYKLWLVKV